MFRKLLDPDTPLMMTFSQIGDFVFLSLFWLVCSLPVVTLGAASAALYDSCYRGFRRGERNTWQRFFQVLRQNLKPGVLPSLVFALVFLGGSGWILWLWNGSALGSRSWMGFSAGAVVGIVLLGMLSLLFPMLSRFENSSAGLLKNTLLLSLSKLPRTVGLGMVNALGAYLCLRYPPALFFLPALLALVDSLLIEPMFRPYLPRDESAA